MSFHFCIYVNGWGGTLKNNAKLYPNGTSLISTVGMSQTTASDTNNYINEKNKSACQWNMTFSPDSKKQAQTQDVILAEDIPSFDNHKEKPSTPTFE